LNSYNIVKKRTKALLRSCLLTELPVKFDCIEFNENQKSDLRAETGSSRISSLCDNINGTSYHGRFRIHVVNQISS